MHALGHNKATRDICMAYNGANVQQIATFSLQFPSINCPTHIPAVEAYLTKSTIGFLPDDHGVVEGAGSQHAPKLGVCPCNLPHWASVALQIGYEAWLLPSHIKHLDTTIRGACCNPAAIVVQLIVMHHVLVAGVKRLQHCGHDVDFWT